MENNGNNGTGTGRKGLWGLIDSIEGDKVIWIIVLLLILISVLAIFSSTSLLSGESRLEIMKNHGKIAIGGLALIFFLYKFVTRIGFYRVLSQFGFIVTFILLLILDTHLNLGFIEAEEINEAYRHLKVFGAQIHVFEVAKVAMVMYLAWALHSYKQDREAMENGEESKTFGLANRLAENKNLEFMRQPFWKRVFYLYVPCLTVFVMIAFGSNSSAIFVAIIMLGTMMIGGVPMREIMMPVVAILIVAGSLYGIHKATDGRFMSRNIKTFESRLKADYDTKRLEKYTEGTTEFYEALDSIRQPYGAKLAIHEGGLTGKGSGNSTQKYSVTHIYSDYMFSFLIEEYGLLGGIFVIILYISLIARSSVIARLCGNEFAKIAVGGLAFLITGQAFMHMLVNAGLGPMTGQTLPLISDGDSAFLVFCLAFGIILSISRMAKKKMQSIEESVMTIADDIQERINILEEIDEETFNGTKV